MKTPQSSAKLVFRFAAIYGFLVLFPQYFLETWINQNFPPAITHPENFYGFIGIALAWQTVFLMIASDVSRYRPLMLPAILEKVAFGGPAVVLFAQGRVGLPLLAAGLTDLALGAAFAVVYRATRSG